MISDSTYMGWMGWISTFVLAFLVGLVVIRCFGGGSRWVLFGLFLLGFADRNLKILQGEV